MRNLCEIKSKQFFHHQSGSAKKRKIHFPRWISEGTLSKARVLRRAQAAHADKPQCLLHSDILAPPVCLIDA